MRGLICAGLLLAAGAAAGKERRGCIVEGRAADPLVIDVAPKGAPAFQVRVSGVPVAAEPQLAEWPAHVEVKGALQFSGTAPSLRLPWKTARAVDATNGMVRLSPATEVRARANMHSKFVDVDVALGDVHLRWLTLPCSALTLDAVARPEISDTPEEHGEEWEAAGKVLHFRSSPGAGAQLEAVLEAPGALEMHKSEIAGAWMRVSSHWLDGTTLVGWVKREELRRPERAEHGLGEVFGAGAQCSRAWAARAGEKLLDAVVAAGTTVYATRYLGPWATVKSAATLKVLLRPKDDWVALVGVPGMNSAGECADHSTVLDEAWVPRQAVRVPGDPAPVAAPVDGGARD